MSLVQVNLPINLINKLQVSMINQGFESIETYIEYTLNNSINNEDLMRIFPNIVRELEVIEEGEIFTIVDLIEKNPFIQISISLLQEIDELLCLYIDKTQQSNTYQILIWDPILYINKYIKL